VRENTVPLIYAPNSCAGETPFGDSEASLARKILEDCLARRVVRWSETQAFKYKEFAKAGRGCQSSTANQERS
jgi:hypothetical protein